MTSGLWRYLGFRWWMVLPLLLGLYFAFSLKVAAQWQKAALLRLGRYRGLRGPGLFHLIPLIDSVSQFVDQRVRVTDVRAETALTRDTVPVNVDAIVFWVVWNPEKAILEVANFAEAVSLCAQTALRESIGRHELAQMITDRETLGHELRKILDEKTNPWGITVQSVEIRDVQLPKELEDAMTTHDRGGRPSRNLQLHRGINFSSTDVGGDLGGFVFAAGSVIVLLIGLPELAPLYLGSLAAGLLLACVLHGWMTRQAV